jgi:hypothetical protein
MLIASKLGVSSCITILKTSAKTTQLCGFFLPLIQICKTFKYITVPLPHDGVVGIDSQQMDKSKGNNVIWANTTIKGVNHMEEFNHPNTNREFRLVLDGRSYGRDTFRKN